MLASLVNQFASWREGVAKCVGRVKLVMVQEFKVPEGRADVVRRKTATPLPEILERSVIRFAPHARRELRRLIRSSRRVSELASIFPGALFALATRRGPAATRLSALAAIENGAPLKTVATALGLPMWMRKLPPEAFDALPERLPMGESFARHVANRMPRTIDESAMWLKTLLFAEQACSAEFAIWLAGQPIYTDDGEPHKLIPVLAAYAWYSGQLNSQAHRLIVVPWRPEIAFDTALCAAKSWFNRVRLVLQLPDGVLSDSWLKPGAALGYTFEPLLDQKSILNEAHFMQNCADQYAERIVREKCRLFSVRRNGARVATLEVGPHSRETGVLAINQLKARHNMAANAEVWQAAYAWMSSQQALKRMPPLAMTERHWDQAAWRDLLKPYRDTHGGAPWFDENASHLLFAGLDADLCDLARRGGVSSWLFT